MAANSSARVPNWIERVHSVTGETYLYDAETGETIAIPDEAVRIPSPPPPLVCSVVRLFCSDLFCPVLSVHSQQSLKAVPTITKPPPPPPPRPAAPVAAPAPAPAPAPPPAASAAARAVSPPPIPARSGAVSPPPQPDAAAGGGDKPKAPKKAKVLRNPNKLNHNAWNRLCDYFLIFGRGSLMPQPTSPTAASPPDEYLFAPALIEPGGRYPLDDYEGEDQELSPNVGMFAFPQNVRLVVTTKRKHKEMYTPLHHPTAHHHHHHTFLFASRVVI